jgi:hypothetical protein
MPWRLYTKNLVFPAIRRRLPADIDKNAFFL